MGVVSLLEDTQERYDEFQRKRDRQKMDPVSDNQSISPLLLVEINKKIEAYNQLIDLAADPEVRWAEKALEYQTQNEHLREENRCLRERVENLERMLARERALRDQERKAHATEIKRLRDKHERELQEYAHKLWQGLKRQDKGSQTHYHTRRFSVKLRDRLTLDQKAKLIRKIS